MEETKNTFEKTQITQKSVVKKLHDIALKAPQCSGVYLWRDEDDTVIYVGKAVILKNRLMSYFSGKKDVKTRSLIAHAANIEYITTNTEFEALILENNLIKQYYPRYNIDLKDGKTYPLLRITNEDFPRVFKTRYMVSDGSKYYGPFPNIPALDSFIELVNRTYKVRKCRQLKKRDKPCLYYHISRCSAPCCGLIDKEKYAHDFEEIIQLLDGVESNETSKTQQESLNHSQAGFIAEPQPEYQKPEDSPQLSPIAKLELAMKEAAACLQFEKAARLRDGIKAVKALREHNSVEDFDPEGRDYIAFHSRGLLVTFIVMRMRNGKLVGRDLFQTKSLNYEEELLSEFLLSYYGTGREIPSKIFVSEETNLELAKEWFSTVLKKNPTILLPNTKRHESVIAMAKMNAKEDIARRFREKGDVVAMEELQKICKLSVLPRHIEGFDIAHIGGRLPVASLIYFKDGNPARSEYRYFRLKTTDGLIDDFSSLKEAVARRYTRLVNENKELPDFILIDGGIGQVSSVKSILDSLGLDIPIAGLAKRDEEIYLPHSSEPIRLPKCSEALKLLQRVRDETHRFATGLNQKLRTKENTKSIFLSLTGVGQKKTLQLISEFGNLQTLIEAEPKKIAQLLKLTEEKASTLQQQAEELLRLQESEAKKREEIDTGGIEVSANMRFDSVNRKKATITSIESLAQQAIED